MGYAYQQRDAKARTARARLSGVNASYKDLCEVCRSVRGRDTEGAIEFLELAAKRERAILFARHNKGKGHRRELGGKKGGWPIKSIKIVLEVLKSAQANASKAGLGTTKVAHIIANKTATFPRMSPKGRRIVHNYETAVVEVVLEETQQAAGAGKSGTKKAEQKKPEAGVPKKAEARKVDAPKTSEAKKADAPRVAEEKKDAPKENEARKTEVPKAAMA